MSQQHPAEPVRARHTHGGPADGAGADWFKFLDVLVWVAVAAIVILGAEWLAGYLMREKLGRQAERFLTRATAKPDAPAAD